MNKLEQESLLQPLQYARECLEPDRAAIAAIIRRIEQFDKGAAATDLQCSKRVFPPTDVQTLQLRIYPRDSVPRSRQIAALGRAIRVLKKRNLAMYAQSIQALMTPFSITELCGVLDAVIKKTSERAPSKVTKTKQALLTLMEQPGWTDKQIAEHVGMNYDALRKSKKFSDARKAQKSGRYGKHKPDHLD